MEGTRHRKSICHFQNFVFFVPNLALRKIAGTAFWRYIVCGDSRIKIIAVPCRHQKKLKTHGGDQAQEEYMSFSKFCVFVPNLALRKVAGTAARRF